MLAAPLPLLVADGMVRSEAEVRLAGTSHRLWYEVPETHAHLVIDHHDHFVLALLQLAMARGEPLRIEGRVSPSLVDNLDHLQEAWVRWNPRTYRRVDIIATEPCERSDSPAREHTLCLFSGGVDAMWTLYRHLADGHDPATTTLVLVNGMGGFQLRRPDVFAAGMAEATTVAEGAGVDLVNVTTNWEPIVLAHRMNIRQVYGSGFVSCLHLVSAGQRRGLISSGHSLDLDAPSGSHPEVDRYLASDRFTVEHSGAGLTRATKIAELTAWDAPVRLLRVCNTTDRERRNCGTCEKCVRTALACQVVGVPVVGDLPEPTLEVVRRTDLTNPTACEEWRYLLMECTPQSTFAPGVHEAMRTKVWRYDHHIPTVRGLRRMVARTVRRTRGSIRRLAGRARRTFSSAMSSRRTR